jgi:hypothetical protein
MASAHSTNRSIGASFASQYAIQQQTFLGCSIVSFSTSAGFGDTASQLSVELAVDNFNNGDGTGLGFGHDVYHDGNGDNFRPPPVGSPVFFNFGRLRATVDEAFRKTYDDYYSTLISQEPTVDWEAGPNFGNVTNGNKGHDHFAFGGILQAYAQNTDATGGTRYTVTVTDPRDILGNCILILNNYAGTTANNHNLINIYGFLEHDVKDTMLYQQFNSTFTNSLGPYYLNESGEGTDTFVTQTPGAPAVGTPEFRKYALSNGRPITGTGMSRRNDAGIPYYRVAQAFNALMGFGSPPLHNEYIQAGYGGYIYFRGLYYAIDLSDLPALPYEYRLDYDQISILDLCSEICDVTNHEFFVALLPITNHPSCSAADSWNDDPNNDIKIGGLIKIISINKNFATQPGQIKDYLDNLNIPIMNKDIGYELTNEVTDKFITGGQEVKMYYFTNNHDTWTPFGMHRLENSLDKQILPFYGTLGKNIVTIPRGHGSYQQIILDAGSLMANGVGRYYVATELELRAASVSFEKWVEFLLMYNDIYKESIEEGDIVDRYYASILAGEGQILELSNNYAVTVPRCVWPPHPAENDFNNGEPLNPCSPPYGWPLYWHRALNIGIPMAGSAGVSAAAGRILKLSGNITTNDQAHSANSPKAGETPSQTKDLANKIANSQQVSIKTTHQNATTAIAISDKVSRSGLANAKLVYNFVKKVADEHLGKKFLVKIPQRPNLSYYDSNVFVNEQKKYTGGPFGFPPIDALYEQTPMSRVINGSGPIIAQNSNFVKQMLLPPDNTPPDLGALKIGYNSATADRSFNYYPEPEGGYYEFGLYSTAIDKKLSLAPKDDQFIKTETGRIKSYVRFDNSQIISFSNFSKDAYAQEYLDATGLGFIPDIAFNMENANNPSATIDSNANVNIPGETSTTSIAFVKAEVDEEYYFAPPLYFYTGGVAGTQTRFNFSITDSQKVFDDTKCEPKDSYRLKIQEHYPLTGLSSSVNLLTIDLASLWAGFYEPNVNHTYALITLPDRAIPTMTTRFRDGMNMQVNNANIKHYLLLDIVRGMPGLNDPAAAAFDQNSAFATMHEKTPISNEQFSDGYKAIQKAYQGLTFSLTNRINIISPSPVYPDMVAIPLRSVERCYGPWLSSYVSDAQVGGKMEFIHDEGLTPWNYGGYSLMDKAGKMQAEFGTSNFLMSERGGFTLPIAPSGIAIGKALTNLGPLVTSISSKIDSAGISTTVTMDLYTASFGKLQKQISDKIKRIGRDRQKIIDERNALLRRNLGKSQKSFNYANFTKMMNQYLNSSNFSQSNYSAVERGEKTANDTMLLGLDLENQPTSTSSAINVNSNQSWVDAQPNVISSIQSHQDSEEIMGILSNDIYGMARNYTNSVEAKMSDIFTPSSHTFHPFLSSCDNMPYAPNRTDYSDDFSDDDLGNFDPVV